MCDSIDVLYYPLNTDNHMEKKEILEELWFSLLKLVYLFDEISGKSFVKEYNKFLNQYNYKEVF